MAQIYGERWEGVQGDLGQGGQSRVLTVLDRRDKCAGPYALKRILNPKRLNRFQNEVEAIKSLLHENIVPLVDHSALNADESAELSKRYIVMPIAKGGDIAKASLNFAGDLDRVLHVAFQVATALKAAHDSKIIHRDVKPENILLTGEDDHIWVCDFGICLIDDGRPRDTPDDEVVGPTIFMAPELEGGDNLNVSPAADVYSLGKVIYFLFTGGIRLPRESLGDDRFASPLAGPGLEGLRLLLAQMICPLAQRLKTMDIILTRLNQLRTPARTDGLSEAGLSARNQAVAKLADDERLRDATREKSRQAALLGQAALAMLSKFIAEQAEAGASALHVEGALHARTRVSSQGGKLRLGNRTVLVIETHEVLYQKAVPPKQRIWALQFIVYQAASGNSGHKFGIIMRLELREFDQKPVRDCSAYLKQERIGRNHVEHKVTNTQISQLEIDAETAAEAEMDVRNFVRNAISSLPDLASRDYSQFISLDFANGGRRR